MLRNQRRKGAPGMTDERIREVMESFASQAKSVYGTKLHQIVLYGSCARGDYQQDSDIDVCVVVENGAFNHENYGAVLLEISRAVKFKYDIDLVMVEQRKAVSEKHRKDLVYSDIFSKGKRFYFVEDCREY